MLEFLRKVRFVGCNGLVVTDEMRLVVAAQACLLIAGHPRAKPYEELMSVLLYPEEFLVNRTTEDEAGVVTELAEQFRTESHDARELLLDFIASDRFALRREEPPE